MPEIAMAVFMADGLFIGARFHRVNFLAPALVLAARPDVTSHARICRAVAIPKRVFSSCRARGHRPSRVRTALTDADIELSVLQEAEELQFHKTITGEIMIDENRVELRREQRLSQGLARVSQIISFLFAIVYTGLLLRLLLALMAARSSAPFVQFIRNVTDPLYAPFRGIVDSPTLAEGGYILAMPIIVAIIVYALVHLGIRSFLRMIVERQTEI